MDSPDSPVPLVSRARTVSRGHRAPLDPTETLDLLAPSVSPEARGLTGLPDLAGRRGLLGRQEPPVRRGHQAPREMLVRWGRPGRPGQPDRQGFQEPRGLSEEPVRAAI